MFSFNCGNYSTCIHLAYMCLYFLPGTWRDEMWPDNWTAVTQDGRLSAQFEHTLLVTDTGVDVLTQRRENNGQPHFMDKI